MCRFVFASAVCVCVCVCVGGRAGACMCNVIIMGYETALAGSVIGSSLGCGVEECGAQRLHKRGEKSDGRTGNLVVMFRRHESRPTRSDCSQAGGVSHTKL